MRVRILAVSGMLNVIGVVSVLDAVEVIWEENIPVSRDGKQTLWLLTGGGPGYMCTRTIPQEVVCRTPGLPLVLHTAIFPLANRSPSRQQTSRFFSGGSPRTSMGSPSLISPFFCARFSNRAMSLGSTTRPRRTKRVSLGGS